MDIKTWVGMNPDLVQVKQQNGMKILKYKNKVMFDDLWNDYLVKLRGTIVSDNWEIISIPFRKVFNYGIERHADVIKENEHVRWFRKINGFMLAVTYHNGELLVSTTGSITSDFVDIGKKHVAMNEDAVKLALDHYWNKGIKVTVMFECVDESDPHFCQDDVGLYYLGAVEHDWNQKVHLNYDLINAVNKKLGTVVEYGISKFSDVIAMTKDAKHEGFMVYSMSPDNQRIVKVKTKFHLTGRLFSKITNIDKLINMSRDRIDEEYYPLLEYLKDNKDHFISLEYTDKINYVRDFILNQ